MYSQEFWNARYQDPAYIYGVEPNAFFKECLDALNPGRLLLPAEGEGRNAVYAARMGWAVDAFDQSIIAREKALQLAAEACTTIHYETSTLQAFSAPANTYDLVGLIYAHVPSAERRQVHQQLVLTLKPSGYLVLEAFHKDQLGRGSGGPKDPDMLYSQADLLDDFSELEILKIEETYVDLHEGAYHNGLACVVRLMARKR
ncbi:MULTISPECIES: bifunctional 2-polyprenyl-6-hydroxyphenol methylase/3-demethylubiquinol 3-O-methyltransferase UbiG [unclassified Spirosoma]|uniref:class I SAM-dependent methyltransferase n=1 Tax=unclassified Spirosoma TaxID=2621999 RepID=UPI00095DBEDF|nr:MULTISPECIES: class I SAM-dependent methyltransferase [unclassified Spirosoma]MBN8824201.1 class I SAM-dependent methyltransferase [Spirosoma sp.]OJW78936.1 MAG: methyltransferase [Spirosoma sp. 48-14]